ncbi:MAG: DUF3887 domain-containing protein [Candidatus Pacebacteria bacterium]|nr:DUF3887 domain-containing protein [Candidatus Paceibacterota bacterium]MDD5753011.1 DUF3887 domain-containing protein [Candidatus Paceibacterota bacterium]
MKNKQILIFLIILIAFCLLGFAYEKSKNENISIFEEGNNIIFEEEQTNEEKVVSFFNALKETDYQKLSKSFTDQLLSELTEEQMYNLRQILFDNLGELINLKDPQTLDGGENRTILFYQADFEKESGVSIRVTFEEDGKMAAIYLDSPKLREAVFKY